MNNSYIFLNEGDKIDVFLGSNQTIGILLLEFDTREDMDAFFETPSTYVEVMIEQGNA